MNSKLKFLEIVLSDLISQRDTLELELNRILNKEDMSISEKKDSFDEILLLITINNNKIQMLGDFMSSITPKENNND
jgi:hypothetical protein